MQAELHHSPLPMFPSHFPHSPSSSSISLSPSANLSPVKTLSLENLCDFMLISIFRHPTTVFLPSVSTSLLRRVSSHLRFSASGENLNLPPRKPNKNLLKAKDSIKELSSLSRDSPTQPRPALLPSQAVGLVAAAQANFMSVIVEESAAENPAGVELLCVVRAVLKKIRWRVLVGDKVLVGSVDWVDRRGMIEDVFQGKTEVAEPPVANVDHLLVLFSMEQPKLEPFSLTRFLVEAESTGISLTLALNKGELVEEEV